MHDEVRSKLDAVIAAMKASGAWDVARPDDAAFSDLGAFGGHTMAFAQWLRFVFVPNVEALIASHGPWPGGSSVATRAAREGDTDPQLAELVPSLSAFDALFVQLDAAAENDAGWALLHKPARTAADREAAVAHFRRAIAADPPQPQAVGNLATALVELGRDADAIAELERIAARDDMLAANAHNWLGWRAITSDSARALVHLREATRLRPQWGVAWQNLARALDASGDVTGACRAYGEAITCGDAHDDAFARDRRLQLEMTLLAAGEPVPPVPDDVLADSIAFGIVRATAARVPSPHTFAIRPTTRASPWAMIGTADGDRALGLAIVACAGGGAAPGNATLTTFAGLDFEHVQLDPARAGDDAATVLLERMAAPAALTPFDAAMWIRDVALAPVGTTWRWELASYRPAALAICEVGGELRVIATARAAGIEIALFPDAVGAESALLVAASPARLVELAPDIAAATRRAIAARETFAGRAFGVHHACAVLGAQLRGMRAPTIDAHYPAWPRAWFVDERDGVTIVWLAESADGCAITIGDAHWTVRSSDELAALAPVLVEAARVDRNRLRPERLTPQARFRVRRAFGGFTAGEDIAFVADCYDPHEGYHRYEFSCSRGVRATLDETCDADVPILAAIDRYLEPL